MERSYIFLAEGFEEIEAIAIIDVMRRAGMDVKSVSITEQHTVSGAHGVEVNADLTFAEADFTDCEWLILPGGLPGSTNLHEYEPLNELLLQHPGKIAAICAAPAVVLAPLGLLEGKAATCYPSFAEEARKYGAIIEDVRVKVLDRIITANGPASAIRIALAIVAHSLGESIAHEVGSGMLIYGKPDSFYF